MSANELDERLSRPLVGERQHGYSRLVLALTARSDRKVIEPRNSMVPKEVPWSKKPRKLYPRVEAAPNAPQLIRLVRTPYALHMGYPKRERYRERLPRLQAHELSQPPMRSAQGERVDMSFASPAEVRELPVAPWRPWQSRGPEEPSHG